MDVENILLNQNHRDPYISNIGELYQFTRKVKPTAVLQGACRIICITKKSKAIH